MLFCTVRHVRNRSKRLSGVYWACSIPKRPCILGSMTLMPMPKRVRSVLLFFAAFQLVSLSVFGDSAAVDWVPTEEEIRKYRRSWNPFSHGPVLLSAVDIQPKGQLHVRPFIFSQIGTRSYGNTLGGFPSAKPGPVHLYSVQDPFIQSAY